MIVEFHTEFIITGNFQRNSNRQKQIQNILQKREQDTLLEPSVEESWKPQQQPSVEPKNYRNSTQILRQTDHHEMLVSFLNYGSLRYGPENEQEKEERQNSKGTTNGCKIKEILGVFVTVLDMQRRKTSFGYITAFLRSSMCHVSLDKNFICSGGSKSTRADLPGPETSDSLRFFIRTPNQEIFESFSSNFSIRTQSWYSQLQIIYTFFL